MGSASVSQTVYTAYGDPYTVYATITWDSTPTVTVSASCSNSAYVYGWRIRGRASQGDSTVYLVHTQGSSFSATMGKDYVFQAYGGDGNYSDGAIFTVSNDSGSGGGSVPPSTDTYLYLVQGEGTELTVQFHADKWLELHNGDQLNSSMYFKIFCDALPGYKLDEYEHFNGAGDLTETTIGYTYDNLLLWRSCPYVGNEDVYYQFREDLDVTVTSSASPKAYTLSLSNDVGSLITVTRLSSKHKDATLGEELYDGDTIYHFDELQISVQPKTGYDLSTYTVNDQLFTSGEILEVSENVSIISTATVKKYTLILDPDVGSTITVNRTQSPLQNATIGILSSNEKIYYSDILVVNLSSSPEYEILEQYVNQEEFTSGDIFEVQDDITVKTITRLRGIAHIYDGSSYNKHLIYIFNNGSWAQYIPYVYQDSTWNICS